MRDIQQDEPASRCPMCGGEVWAGEVLFEWEGGFVCVDCFRDAMRRMSDRDPVLLAAEMGLSTKEASG